MIENFSNYFLILFFIYSMYNLKTIPIFASNYNLNIMLRVQEICKSQGITMQDLAKRMGVTYQALYAAVSGNPTIGKLGEIAKALDVGIIDLLNEDKEENAIICPHCGKKIKIEKGE
ncbi:helix-turn-helix domain-containing protein [Bacteroides stercoris]|uniref:helix-turn-helix domain-containing protein n=3 Tax=Bacteroidales TaxID=171549 RepID=UPI001CCA754E|nr:helix-turn-helix transcriptional regulator [Bacteroides stercoris]